MLKYTRWIASSAPMLSSPPFRMWCTASCARPLRQHLFCRPGSHQHVSWSSSFCSQLAALRHLTMSSLAWVSRCLVLISALMVPGLFTWSVGMAEVSEVPGRACAKICHSGLSVGMPDTISSEMRRYWLPTPPLMFSHLGCSASLGGLSGSKAMWHEPQDVPIRNGGSTAPSASRLVRPSVVFGLDDSRRLKPSQVPSLPSFSSRHFSASKRGLGNLRKPSAPVEVPKARSQDDWR